MKRRIICALIGGLVLLTGCSNSDKHGDDCMCMSCENITIASTRAKKDSSFLKIDSASKGESSGIGGVGQYEIVDPETGVHYLLVIGTESMTMTVMYNADSTIKAD